MSKGNAIIVTTAAANALHAPILNLLRFGLAGDLGPVGTLRNEDHSLRGDPGFFEER